MGTVPGSEFRSLCCAQKAKKFHKDTTHSAISEYSIEPINSNADKIISKGKSKDERG
jgi:hypothetical protein